MEKVIIGAGGFAREVKKQMGDLSIKLFVDDEFWFDNKDNIHKISELDIYKQEVIIAIGNPIDRYNIVNKLPKDTKFFTFIHNSAIILSDDIEIGDGSIICAGCILTTNIKLGKHTHLNLQTTIGHDTIVGDFFTTAPGVKISGNCNIGKRVYFGTNSSVREKIELCDDVVIGLNSGVIKNINVPGIYGGLPVKLLKKYE
jgi:sugar O-acyltransferase (sialic acid O-acetyltransferase NeuD family)